MNSERTGLSPEEQRLADFGRWSAGVWHDLANPLTSALLSLEQLKRRHQPELIHEVIDSLEYACRYIEAARERLRDPYHTIPFTLAQEISRVVRVLAPKASRAGVRVEQMERSCHQLVGDPVKFGQVVFNLVANAIDAYQPLPYGTNRRIRIGVTAKADGVRITVEDWGTGIPKAHHTAVFLPFFTTKTTRHNSGLGLPLVKRIIEEDFGGTIGLTSTPGRGTRLTIWLPGSRP